MRDLAFYNAGCVELRGLQRLTVPFRRALRYLLRPIFFRQVELLEQMDGDLEALTQAQRQVAGRLEGLSAALIRLRSEVGELRTQVSEMHGELHELRQAGPLSRRLDRLEGLEEDHLAAVRRLAAIEDGIEALSNK